MKTVFNSILPGTCLLLFAVLVFAFSAVAQEQKPLIEVNSQVDTSLITIGDRITYTVSINHKEGLRVENPGAGVNLGQFEIKDYSIQEPRITEGRTSLKYEYVISVFDTGRFTIPPFPVAYFLHDSLDDYRIIEASAIDIFVESVMQDGAGELRDIKVPIYIPYDYVFLFSMIAVVLLLAVAGYLAYHFYKKRREQGYLIRPPEPQRPAHETALEALQQLLAKALLQEGQIKQFYVELSEIIRRYIEGRYFVPALEETSAEIISELTSQEIESGALDGLKELLELSDLVKFAKYRAQDKESENAVDLARSFIEETKIIFIPVTEKSPEKRETEINIQTESNKKTEDVT